MIKKVFFSIFTLILAVVAVISRSSSLAQDGIPDNCEYSGQYQRESLFPRYEYNNSRFVLVDWATGEDVVVLETGLSTESFWIVEWSRDCRYLVGAVDANRNYYVWDTVDTRRVAVVNDAKYIQWSPSSTHAILHSENGGYLLNLATNNLTLLTDEYDGVLRRSFRRVTWDEANNAVTVRFISNTDHRYDLNTGLEIALPPPPVNETLSQVNVAGNNYNCTNNYIWRSSPNLIQIEYDRTTQQLIATSDGVLIQVLSENLTGSRFVGMRWSYDCRYFTFALGNSQVTDTYVWDVAENRPAGIFLDARQFTHQFSWSTFSHDALIQTRNGAYLWHIPTDTRTLLSTGGFSRRWGTTYNNFHSYYWNEDTQELHAVTVEASNGLTIFDVPSGEQTAFYVVEDCSGYVAGGVFEDSTWILLNCITSSLRQGALWNHATGQGYQLLGVGNRYSTALSPDERYFVYHNNTNDLLRVWDLTNINPDGSPTYTHPIVWQLYLPRIQFIDDTTIEFGAGIARYDVVTGERIAESSLVTAGGNAPQAINVANSDGGFSAQPTLNDPYPNNCEYADAPYRQPNLVPYKDRAGRYGLIDWTVNSEILVLFEENVTRVRSAVWSPDCRYLIGQLILDDSSFNDYVAWDTTTGERVQTFEAVYYSNRVITHWSPFGDVALIGNRWLWHVPSNMMTPLQGNLGRADFRQVYWDIGRNQLIVSGWGGAIAYDLTTGVLIQVYTHPDEAHSRFTLSDDRSMLIVFTNEAQGGYDYSGLAVWNLNTLETIAVNVDGWVPYPSNIRLSSDNRYLALRGTVIRVWDLWTLSRNYDEQSPLHRLPIDSSSTWYFESASVIVIETGGDIQRWDLETGNMLTE